MWVIFLLSAMSVAVCAMLIVWVGNKILIAIEEDRKKQKTKNEKENKQ